MRQCVKCKECKSNFVGNICRNCYQKDYYKRNRLKLLKEDKERKKKAYRQNKDKFLLKNKEYYAENRESVLESKKEYYKNNKSNIQKTHRGYYNKNKEVIVKHNISYINNRSKIDECFRLSRNLRSRLNKALHGNYKSGSAVKDLGCSIEELKKHLESKFQEGMSWDNYGLRGWHVDHIQSLITFNLSDPEELKKACYYTNLQPLWAEDNLSKGSKDEIC